MRLLLRSHRRVHAPALARTPAPLGEARREWIEALFDNHLPRSGERRERAIAELVGDGDVWRLLHQARHSMTETTATIERLAARAIDQFEELRAA